MKNLSRFFLIMLPVLAASFMLFTSCEDEETEAEITPVLKDPILSDVMPVSVYPTSAKIMSRVVFTGGHTIEETGFYYSTTSTPTSGTKITSSTSSVLIYMQLDGLDGETTYYICSYARIEDGRTFYSQTTNFATIPFGTTPPEYGAASSTAYLEQITIAFPGYQEGDMNVTGMGYCWSTTGDPTTADNTIATTDFMTGTDITGLLPATQYYIRAYVDTDSGPQYSATETISTLAPTVTAGTIESTYNSITLTGATFDFTPAKAGVVVSPNSSIMSGTATEAASLGAGTFDVTATGLSKLTDYYVWAFIELADGRKFYSAVTQKSTADDGLVVLIGNNLLCSSHRAFFDVSVSNAGISGDPVTEVGLVWSETTNPKVDPTAAQYTNHLAVATPGAGVASYDSIPAMVLKHSTKYYIRGYAKNANGYSYSSDTREVTTLIGVTSEADQTGARVRWTNNAAGDGGSPTTNTLGYGTAWNSPPYRTDFNKDMEDAFDAAFIPYFSSIAITPGDPVFRGVRFMLKLDESNPISSRKALIIRIFTTNTCAPPATALVEQNMDFGVKISFDMETEILTPIEYSTSNSVLTSAVSITETVMQDPAMAAVLNEFMDMFMGGPVLLDRAAYSANPGCVMMFFMNEPGFLDKYLVMPYRYGYVTKIDLSGFN